VHLRVGTSGFAYKEWLGRFYPADLKAAGMLGYYAGRFSTVEINNTFYQLPKVETLTKWAGEVPESFRFVLKASQRITHQQRLRGSEDTLLYLLRTAQSGLGDRLGPLLFQLPPNLRADRERLAGFLALLPRECPAAFEFRHPSWEDPAIVEVLREHAVAWCVADTDEEAPEARDAAAGSDGGEPAVPALPPIVGTTSWGYFRLRRLQYDAAAMERWIAALRTAAREHAWREIYVFFKHEDEGTGPRFAAAFADAWRAREAEEVTL
jgi:uncharacterized protein YecE (DUF72 family)